MILRGVIENIFGGALSFRGFAKISDLAKLSKIEDTYQRPVDVERSKAILEFLKNSEFRFFSEVTLCLNFNDGNAITKILSGTRGLVEEDIDLTVISKDFKDYEAADKFDSPLLRRIALEFKTTDKKYLSRIDGSHRLSAIDILLTSVKEEDKQILNGTVLDYYVPFNILLQQKNDESLRLETAYFHLINSKSERLTSEQNLKSILEGNLFSDGQLTELLGKNALQTKQLYSYVKEYQFLSINSIIDKSLKTFCLQCSNLLVDEKANTIQKSIQQVDAIYADEHKLSANKNVNLLLAFIYIKVKEKPEVFKKFRTWILTNQLFDIAEVNTQTIIDVFIKMHEKRTYSVFVAMPYWSHAEVTEYNKLFKAVCEEVTKKANTTVELIPIMRFSGKSQRIDKRLIEKIKECDIFIADITGSNANVVFEVGFAEGQNKHMILLKAETDPSVPPFDMDKLQYIPYNRDTYYNSIKDIAVRNILSLLKSEFNIL
ncbi:nucleoside 2-deoxyribosyltransferase [Chryseobacterium aahli]|uniref:nucleoside 2-deoxyribosyltransferase n=1 Tax=Chryseobacterium aahli TaxID=1278643 RepID=UPI001F6129A0|nr:nucleoside 2-deoxyribosyltransferase [Chryseobacterium aahli]MCI3939369.1 nucleoside 2-deoxyribosyltransferase [Chryseobacterium aahli]